MEVQSEVASERRIIRPHPAVAVDAHLDLPVPCNPRGCGRRDAVALVNSRGDDVPGLLLEQPEFPVAGQAGPGQPRGRQALAGQRTNRISPERSEGSANDPRHVTVASGPRMMSPIASMSLGLSR